MLESSQAWLLTLIEDGEKEHALKSANGQNWAREGWETQWEKPPVLFQNQSLGSHAKR